MNFINSIESIGVKNKGRVIVDLSKVKFASAAASVLFFAIVNRAQFLTRTLILYVLNGLKRMITHLGIDGSLVLDLLVLCLLAQKRN